ncbi:hypothetical protein B0H11DRAFT_1878849 [Mycena galericulata]|nr:hypothetical protein B0H11DRAFT_1878849 [Mycena galericulata]
MPFGSHLEKLRNLESMRRYAAANADSWYKYANGPRGRGLTNGSLYLVTGCEKSRSWGMAAFQETQDTFQLLFKLVTSPTSMGNRYQWFNNGTARTKESGLIPTDGVPFNQTLFVHGLSISLGTSIWAKLFKGAEISQIEDPGLGRYNNDFVPYGSHGSSFSWSLSFFGGAISGGKQCAGARGNSGDGVTMSEFSPTSKARPCIGMGNETFNFLSHSTHPR